MSVNPRGNLADNNPFMCQAARKVLVDQKTPVAV